MKTSLFMMQDSLFFNKYPLINPKIFLGDASFDSVAVYKELLTENTFGCDNDGNNRILSKTYIPLNSRSSLEIPIIQSMLTVFPVVPLTQICQ